MPHDDLTERLAAAIGENMTDAARPVQKRVPVYQAPNQLYGTGLASATIPQRTMSGLLRDDMQSNCGWSMRVADRIGDIANRLLGSVPSNGTDKTPGVREGNGLIDQLRSVAAIERDALVRIDAVLSRMEADLG